MSVMLHKSLPTLQNVPDTKRNMAANALRRGLVSTPHANYFVTACLEPRVTQLTGAIARHVSAEAYSMSDDAVWSLRCATVMPDHIHLLFTLGEHLTLSQSIGRLKSKTRTAFDLTKANWQENFYDHHLRANDSVEATIRYLHQNPYQAGLITAAETWPHFYCCEEDWAWFEKLTDAGQPYPEWLL